MRGAVDVLLGAQAELARRPVAQILASLERVTKRWLDHADPIRVEAEARLAESTGLAPTMLRLGLDQMIRRVEGIGDLLDQDLGARELLDQFGWRAGPRSRADGPGPRSRADGPGLRSRAYGPGLLVCLFSGNLPGIPAFDMALSLALKSACLARPAAAEPHFAGLFARSVAEVDPLLGRCLAVARWGYDDPAPYERAGAVLAYGSDQSIAAIRQMVPPGIPFIGHGHKIGFAVVAREAATAQTASLLALDVAMYEQQGCVSPQMVFVERGGALTPTQFAQACGEALADLEEEMPRGRLSLDEASALRGARDEAEFAADALFASTGSLAWAVVHEERPRFLPSPLNRLLRSFAVNDLADLLAVIAPQAGYLQTVTFAGPITRREALAEELGRLGASRVAPVGRAQQPDPLWRHDGKPTAGALVRWIDLEGGE